MISYFVFLVVGTNYKTSSSEKRKLNFESSKIGSLCGFLVREIKKNTLFQNRKQGIMLLFVNKVLLCILILFLQNS